MKLNEAPAIVEGRYFIATLTELFRLTAKRVNRTPELQTSNTYTACQLVTPVALTDGANIATDAALSNSFYVTLGGNRTLDNPTNLKHGAIYNWRIKQDGTGSRTLAYGSKFKWPGGTAPVLTTTASATDFISGQYWSDTDTILCTYLPDFA